MTFLRESLAAYKLEVAKSYASIPYLKEVERQLTSHLVRIENKLDGSIARPGSGGTTHYHATSITPPWAVGREPSAIIGNHLFYNDVE